MSMMWKSQFLSRVYKVFCPTHRTNMAQDLCLGGSGCRAVAQTRRAFPKTPWASPAFPYTGRLRHQAMNLALPRRVRACGDALLMLGMPIKANLDRLSAESEHTRPDPCTDQHGRPRRIPAQQHSEPVHTHVFLKHKVWIHIFPSPYNSYCTKVKNTSLSNNLVEGDVLDSYFSVVWNYLFPL